MRSFLVCSLMALLFIATQYHCVRAEEVDYHALLQRYLQGNSSAEHQLLNSPAALPFIEQQLQPAKTEALQIEIDPLIQQLGDPEFAVRQNASQVLHKTLPNSRSKLEATLKRSDDIEVTW